MGVYFLKQYLIRERCFQYQDDCSAIAGYHRLEIFTNAHDADKHWFDIEVSNARQGNIYYEGEAIYFGTLPTESIRQLREIFSVATGKQDFLPDRWIDYQNYFGLLSDAQLFQVVTLTQQNRYELIHYQSEQPLYAVWIPEARQYLTNSDAHTLYYSTCLDELSSDSHVANDVLYCDANNELLEGTLEQISPTPQLLISLINAHPQHFNYYPTAPKCGPYLGVSEKLDALLMVSPLLHRPLLEIHQLTPEQIVTLHTLINQEATHHPNFQLSE